MIVLAAQYRPTPDGVAMTNQANIAGIIHCIIAFICCCCSLFAAAPLRPEEMRCCSHMVAKTMATRNQLPLAARSMPRNVKDSGMASWMIG